MLHQIEENLSNIINMLIEKWQFMLLLLVAPAAVGQSLVSMVFLTIYWINQSHCPRS